jgi:hypothetical protein
MLVGKRFITVIFILMTFVSQAFASVILPCPSDMNSMLSPSNVITTDTSTTATNTCHHQLMSDTDLVNKTTSDTFDCCDNQCDCPMGSCFSIALEIMTIQSVTLSNVSRFIPSLTQHTIPQFNVSLYRPPIIIS